MSAWWQDLSPRERIMLYVAAALAGVLVLSLGVIRPLADWRENAKSSVSSARDAYELTAAAAAVSGGQAPAQQSVQTPLRQIFVSTAAAAGIELVRIGSEDNNQLEIQIAPVDGDVLFAWLSDLEARYGVTVAFADIARDDAGQVNAQVLVFERR